MEFELPSVALDPVPRLLPGSPAPVRVRAYHGAGPAYRLQRMCEGGATAPPLILIVDDDAEWRAALRSLLEHSGYRVAEAENGRVALRTARERNPDLVLLDLAMPVLDGFETARRLRRDGGPPLLAVSGEELTPAQDRNMRALFDGYVKSLRRRSSCESGSPCS